MGYINKKIKKVSEEALRKALREVNAKNAQRRKEDKEALNAIWYDGFRCSK